MTLFDTLQAAVSRFRSDSPPMYPIRACFVTPDEPPLTVMVTAEKAEIRDGSRDADFLICGTTAQIAALMNPNAPDRQAAAEQITIQPDYPYKNAQLAALLTALDLTALDLAPVTLKYEGPYPFPVCYPAAENRFRVTRPSPHPIPAYDRHQLPALIADEHPLWEAMANRAWEIAFDNLRKPGSGLRFSFIDTAFNTNTFLWDSAFMMMFGRYGRRLFPFMGTLDNFYASQHEDGFICREINTYTGKGIFQPLDPRSTGPNIFAWAEYEWYQHTGDRERLQAVFPALIAYHQWWKTWRMHPDGGYWTCGWGSGMDNQNRVPDSEYHHRNYTWVDATLQQAINCEILIRIGRIIERTEFEGSLAQDLRVLEHYVNTNLWDEGSGFYFDRAPTGTLSRIKSIGAFWGLLTGVVPDDRADRLIMHLQDPKSFNRPHRVPSQAFDSEDYSAQGGYWLGGVWASTNYMVLRGLTARGEHQLAHEIALNHITNVAQVFEHTGTLWENYAPEVIQQGDPARSEFVGWTGVSAIAIPIEYGVGIRPSDGGQRVHWDIRLTERHGILRLPLGDSNMVDLVCEKRIHTHDAPEITVQTLETLTLYLTWADQEREVTLTAGEHHLAF